MSASGVFAPVDGRKTPPAQVAGQEQESPLTRSGLAGVPMLVLILVAVVRLAHCWFSPLQLVPILLLTCNLRWWWFPFHQLRSADTPLAHVVVDSLQLALVVFYFPTTGANTPLALMQLALCGGGCIYNMYKMPTHDGVFRIILLWWKWHGLQFADWQTQTCSQALPFGQCDYTVLVASPPNFHSTAYI